MGKSGVLEHKSGNISEHVKIEEKLLMTFSLNIIIVKENIFLIFVLLLLQLQQFNCHILRKTDKAYIQSLHKANVFQIKNNDTIY